MYLFFLFCCAHSGTLQAQSATDRAKLDDFGSLLAAAFVQSCSKICGIHQNYRSGLRALVMISNAKEVLRSIMKSKYWVLSQGATGRALEQSSFVGSLFSCSPLPVMSLDCCE